MKGGPVRATKSGSGLDTPSAREKRREEAPADAGALVFGRLASFALYRQDETVALSGLTPVSVVHRLRDDDDPDDQKPAKPRKLRTGRLVDLPPLPPPIPGARGGHKPVEGLTDAENAERYRRYLYMLKGNAKRKAKRAAK